MSLQTVLYDPRVDEITVTEVEGDGLLITELDDEELLLITEVSLNGKDGKDGPPGPAGDVAVQCVAGELLSALTVVYLLDGKVYKLNFDDGAHIDLVLGVTLNASLEGGDINVQRLGIIDDGAWAWTPGRIYLGVDGALTEVPPDTGFCLLIGSATSATSIILNIQDAIELE